MVFLAFSIRIELINLIYRPILVYIYICKCRHTIPNMLQDKTRQDKDGGREGDLCLLLSEEFSVQGSISAVLCCAEDDFLTGCCMYVCISVFTV